MALTDESGMNTTMLVSPSGHNTSGFGGDGWWVILLILLIAAGGWGGFNGGANQPYLMNDTQRGFDQASIMGGINGVQAGINGISTQLCNGFAGVNSTVNSGFFNAETAANARQMANMQTAFANQSAMTQGFNQISSQFANCCCENRLGIANLANVVQTENCADRAALSDGIRDLLTNQTANTQRILDQLCADKIDAKNEKIADLERQLAMANLAASQTAQTSRILADNAAQTSALEQYLNPVPIPAYTVQNPNCCTNSCGCGSF